MLQHSHLQSLFRLPQIHTQPLMCRFNNFSDLSTCLRFFIVDTIDSCESHHGNDMPKVIHIDDMASLGYLGQVQFHTAKIELPPYMKYACPII
jgi:hypothetical protein